jgi:hypothetical protein
LDIYDCFLLAGPYDCQSLTQEAEQAVALNRP